MTLKSLSTALDVLHQFTKENPEWGLRELASELEMSHTVLHRILKTFQNKGYIIQNKSKKYELGLKILDLSAVIQDRVKLSDLVYPVMKEISEETQETVFLTWLEGCSGVTVDIAESEQKIKFLVSKGYQTPLYVGASTKVIMAYLDKEVQQGIIEQGVKRFTKNTIVEPSRIFSDLAKIKRKGWCYTEGEFSEEVFGLAVPLFNQKDEIIASLTVSGPLYRLTANDKKNILKTLLGKKQMIEQYIQLLDAEDYR